jgi:hypothetical protein
MTGEFTSTEKSRAAWEAGRGFFYVLVQEAMRISAFRTITFLANVP